MERNCVRPIRWVSLPDGTALPGESARSELWPRLPLNSKPGTIAARAVAMIGRNLPAWGYTVRMRDNESENLTDRERLPREVSIPVGVVIRRTPSKSRWVDWNWLPVALLPGAPAAEWKLLREEEGAAEFHAATVNLTLHRAETEAYRVGISNEPPSAWVVLAPIDDPDDPREFRVQLVTASPFEAQDCLDSGEEIVEAVPMPPGLIAWVRDFVQTRHVEEPFYKRKRREVDIDQMETGRGDPRVRQAADVYRAPGYRKPRP